MREWVRRMEEEGRMAGIREAQARLMACRRERRGARPRDQMAGQEARDQEAGQEARDQEAGAGAGQPLPRRRRGPAA